MALPAHPRRLGDALLVAVLGLVPAVVLTVLGLRAIANEDAAVRREAAQLVESTASRLARQVGEGLDRAAEGLAALDAVRLPEGESALAAVVRESPGLPPGADFVAFGFANGDGASTARASGPPPPSWDECVALGRDRSRPKVFAERCADVRDASGRWIFPVFAAAPPVAPLAPELVAWLAIHGARMAPAERAALDGDVRALTNPTQRASLEVALREVGASPSSPEARRAAEPGARGWPDARGIVSWQSDGSRGVLRALDRGRSFGFVVYRASLERALRSRALELPADLVASADGHVAARPQAVAALAPGLALVVALAHPAELEGRSRAQRWVVGASLGGATLVLVALGVVVGLRMRRMRRTSELRTDFVAAVSHELRTPVASLRMLAELLEEGRVEDDERAEVHQALAREARRLSTTVDRLLQLRLAFAGKKAPLPGETDVTALVAEAVDAFEEQHPEAGAVATELSSVRAAIDPAALRLALDNLLDNARKHAPAGAPYRVRLTERGQTFELQVEDAGPGIEGRDQARIFLAFERADDRLSRATEGFGIGLALVRHVARSHGGAVGLESEPGRGARFWMRMPVGRAAAERQADPDRTTQERTP